MSRFSGKCDLFDHMLMLKTYDKGSYKTSDEMECFEIFKKQTGGIIYQNVPIEYTTQNIDLEIEKINNPNILRKEIIQVEKSYKGKQKLVNKTIYYFYGKKYTSLKAINALGPHTMIEIKFNTILDIIPYYPYLICQSCGNFICIDSQSYVDVMASSQRKNGFKSKMNEIYKRDLQEHYREVVLRYLNPEGKEVNEDVEVYKENDSLYAKTTFPIDTNFALELNMPKERPYYTHPTCVDPEQGIIDVTRVLVRKIKPREKLTISYVKKEPYEKYLE